MNEQLTKEQLETPQERPVLSEQEEKILREGVKGFKLGGSKMKKLIVFMVLVQLIFVSYTVRADHRPAVPAELTVKDKKTHKIWMKDANVLGKAMTWDEAFNAIKNLNEQKYAGLQCWRCRV